ncbi:MAG: hypothetical protein A2Y04_05040 [Omnitrophica WOR_2 bacterium GWC2_45_7]|nr:MAG: hypothetical protein A2Y04_05040 [Omnitrophica WOR_2 bacterium GWC2_45_7]
MNLDKLRELARRIINKGKWWDMLSRFIDVLRINIFVVDSQGFVILPPEEGKYGGRLLTNRSLGLDLPLNSEKFIHSFHQQEQGKFFESVCRYDLRVFALPINIEKNQTMAHMIVGPVILAKKLDMNEYNQLAQKYGVDNKELMDEIGEIRIVSHVMMNSILDLLSEIIRDNLELSSRSKELSESKWGQEVLSKEVSEAAQEIYSTVRLDELLVTLLDVALKMTDTECGSIMVVDADQPDYLTIKVSRGLERGRVYNTRVKVGDGIAGLAAQENECFCILGQETANNRIRHLLKRSDVKHSLVMPLVAKERVFGVLNLHTKKNEDKIDENLQNLQYLSKLLSSAF